MITRISAKRIVTPGGVIGGFVYFENGKITYVGGESRPFDREIDAGERYVLPGLIDTHVHGARGFDFCEADVEGILAAVEHHVRHGATTLFPTVTSSDFARTFGALENLEKAMQDPRGAAIAGVHLEGPYLSLAQCGAQDKSLITPPVRGDYEKLIDRFGAIIKRWDYAPERDEGGEFCAYLKAHGILPSAGHTDAIYDDMKLARENGCRLITHFYSCTSTITRDHGFRRLGVLECGYLWDDMYIEIIADGKHLPPELLQLIFKLKPHDKILLISDALKVTGENALTSSVGTTPCIIEDGVCKLLDRSAFAGSIATADRLLRTVVREAGLPLADAVQMGATNPAALMGLNKGALAAGMEADILITDEDFAPQIIFRNGAQI